MTQKSLSINPEFESIIPPLTDEEFKQLEENIVAEGEVFTPIFTWQGFIIDGHHRYKIIQKHPSVRYSIREKEFDNVYEVLSWICNNQLGRRNLSEIQRTILIGRRYDAEKKAHGAVDGFRGNQHSVVSPQIEDLPQTKNKTAEKMAEEMGISKSSIERAASFVKGLDAAEEVLPGIEQEIISGTITPTKQEVIAISKAAPEERREMAEELRLPKEERAARRSKRELLRKIGELSADKRADKPTVTIEAMLRSVSLDVDTAISSMEVYFADCHDAFTDIEFKPLFDSIIEKLENYTRKLRGEQNYEQEN